MYGGLSSIFTFEAHFPEQTLTSTGAELKQPLTLNNCDVTKGLQPSSALFCSVATLLIFSSVKKFNFFLRKAGIVQYVIILSSV